MESEIEILFHTSSRPKRFRVVALYTKDALLCCQRADGMIVKYPLLNVFQVAHMHGEHCNSEVNEYKMESGNSQSLIRTEDSDE